MNAEGSAKYLGMIRLLLSTYVLQMKIQSQFIITYIQPMCFYMCITVHRINSNILYIISVRPLLLLLYIMKIELNFEVQWMKYLHACLLHRFPECLLCSGSSLHQPNVATDIDGHLVFMYKIIPVLKCLSVMGHQVNNSNCSGRKHFFVLYVHFLCKFDLF